MKQLLVDQISVISSPLVILEGKSPLGRMRLRGKLQEADVKNGNQRVYPRDVLEEKINQYINNFVKTKTSMGELDHPDSSIVNLGNVSHLITKIWWEGNDVLGELEILNTPSGRIAEEIVKAGIPLGISSRGLGSVKQIGESVEVQDDLEFVAWDFVSTPSTPNSFMREVRGINEGLNKNIIQPTKYQKANSIITEILCSRGFCSCELE